MYKDQGAGQLGLCQLTYLRRLSLCLLPHTHSNLVDLLPSKVLTMTRPASSTVSPLAFSPSCQPLTSFGLHQSDVLLYLLAMYERPHCRKEAIANPQHSFISPLSVFLIRGCAGASLSRA